MGYINLSLQFNIKKGRRNIFKKNISKSVLLDLLVRSSVQFASTILLSVSLLLGSSYPLVLNLPINIVRPIMAEAQLSGDSKEIDKSRDFALINSTAVETITDKRIELVEKVKTVSLQDKYRRLAGSYYYSNVEPYLPIIDKVLSERGLDNDELFIQAMFFIGQYESHWNTQSISGSTYGGEHPTGIFQFLPSTFRSVSSGDIFDAEGQIRAYVTMVERGRVREYGTLYLPGLSPIVRGYVVNFQHLN